MSAQLRWLSTDSGLLSRIRRRSTSAANTAVANKSAGSYDGLNQPELSGYYPAP